MYLRETDFFILSFSMIIEKLKVEHVQVASFLMMRFLLFGGESLFSDCGFSVFYAGATFSG